MTPRRVTLDGGPAAGAEVLVSRHWVYVSVLDGGEVAVFDSDAPNDTQEIHDMLNRVGRGGWIEYIEDETNPDVFRPTR